MERAQGGDVRLVSFVADGASRYGLVKEGGIVDLSRRHKGRWPDLLSLLRAGELRPATEAASALDPDYALSDIVFLPPVPNPEKTICVGVNFLGRNEEFPDPTEHKYPSLFFRTPNSLVGHDVPIERPKATNEFDYEGEIALVISKAARKVAAESALDYVLGATLCNEGTVHDWLHHGRRNNTPGKNFDRSGSIGPWIVTTDEIDLKAPLQVTTKVNGEVRQQDTTDRMIFSFQKLIAYITSFATLKAGDVVVTGTPVGSGRWFQPPKWLAAGDVVEVSVPEIGVLRNAIVDEVAD
jgi:2-keto-4-pentenoate hydratase/2-oxohepta-3-ene-1,7-dioic acid hydratase in catechol pathway